MQTHVGYFFSESRELFTGPTEKIQTHVGFLLSAIQTHPKLNSSFKKVLPKEEKSLRGPIISHSSIPFMSFLNDYGAFLSLQQK